MPRAEPPPAPPALSLEELRALPPAERAHAIGLLPERPMFKRPDDDDAAKALELLPLLKDEAAPVRLAASRALRKLALDGCVELDALLEAGLLETVTGVLARPDTVGDVAGNLMHALCRLTKDSQEAVTRMAEPGCPLAGAIGAAITRCAALPPAPPPGPGDEPPKKGYTRGRADDDPDGDPLEEGADLLDELWQRLPEGTPEVVAHWAAATLPAALALAERADAPVTLALRAAVNVLGTEAGGERWEDGEAHTREPPPGQPPRPLAPLHAAAVPRMAAAAVRAMEADDPNDFGGGGALEMAAALCRKRPAAGALPLVAAGAGRALPRWLASTRSENADAAAKLLGGLLASPTVAQALLTSEAAAATTDGSGSNTGSLVADVMRLLRAPYAPPPPGEEGEGDDEDEGERLVPMGAKRAAAAATQSADGSDGGGAAAPAPAAKQKRAAGGRRRGRGGAGGGFDSLRDWDSHMYVVTGLAGTLSTGSGAGDGAAATTGDGSGSSSAAAALPAVAAAAGALVDAGAVEALLTVATGAYHAPGGFGRCLALLVRHALVALQGLLTAAPEGARARAAAAGVADALARVAGRPELRGAITDGERRGMCDKDPSSSRAGRGGGFSMSHSGLYRDEGVPHDAPTLRAVLQQLTDIVGGGDAVAAAAAEAVAAANAAAAAEAAASAAAAAAEAAAPAAGAVGKRSGATAKQAAGSPFGLAPATFTFGGSAQF